MDWRDTPVFVTNFNNLERGFRRLIEWLELIGMGNVTVIDNASTYGPLTEFYEGLSLPLLRQPSNLGPYAFWELRMHEAVHSRYIVTDPDVLPAPDCPSDVVARMHEMMDKYQAGKVGPSLRTDNLPDHFALKADVVAWEKQFWERLVPDGDVIHAGIDTTFALYPPGATVQPGGHSLRLAPPYSFEHLPWYEDTSNPTAEALYYRASLNPQWTHWSRQA